MIERGVMILPVATLVPPWPVEDLKRQLDEADHQVFLLSRENGQLKRRMVELIAITRISIQSEGKVRALDAR